MSLPLMTDLRDFPAFKVKLFQGLWKVQLLGLVPVFVWAPSHGWNYVYGCVLAWFYLKSLASSAQFPQKAMSSVQTVVRMLLTAVLIILLGEHDLVKTAIVFLGFLSYKGVLVLELLRTLIGNWRHSDQRNVSPFDDSGGQP